MVLENNGVLVDGKWSNFWFLSQYVFKDAWMDGLLSRWFHRWVQIAASLLSNLPTLIPSNSLSHSWWSMEATAVCSSFCFFLYGSLLRSKKTPSRSLQKEPFHSEKLFLSMPSKWHHSTLKNSSYRCIQNDTLPTSFRSQKLPAPIPLNNPSHALKTPSLDPFKQPLSSSQNSPSRSLQTTTSHTVKLSLPLLKRPLSCSQNSLLIPLNRPSQALKTLLFYPL